MQLLIQHSSFAAFQGCEDCSAAADLREELEKHPLPSIAAATIDSRVMTAQETTKQAQAVLIHDGAPPSHTGHLTGGMFARMARRGAGQV